MDKEKIQQIIDGINEKIGPALEAIKNYVNSHKVLTSIVCVVVALVLSVAVFVMDKLNRINYNDGSTPSLMYTEPSGLVTGPTSAMLTTTEKKGKFESFKAADGSLIFKDGSYVNTLGAGVLNDGTTIYPTGIVVFQDGSYIIGSGIRVDKEGIATFSDGSQLHMSLFSIAKNGQILLKSPDGTLTYVNNVAEQAVINSAQGSVPLSPGATSPSLQNPVTTTRPIGNSDILSNINNSSGTTNNNSNSTPNQTPVINNTPVQDVDDIVIEDVMNNVDQSVKEEIQQNDQAIEQNRNNKEIWYSDDVINILLMGIDNGGKNYPYGRSDAMIVASINKKTKAIKLISSSGVAIR